MRKLALLALSLVGLFDALYLLWVYLSPSRPLLCLGTGCDVVRSSSYAHFWGIPMPAFGVAMYSVQVVLLLAAPLADWGLLRRLMRLAVAGIAGFSVLVSLYLTYLEKFVIHAWCAWCVTSAIIVTLILVLAVLDLRQPDELGDPMAALAATRQQFVLVLAALVIGIPSFHILAHYKEIPPLALARDDVFTAHLVRPDSHVAGNAASPVTVVEFSDFECPYCGSEEPTVTKLREKYGSQVRFVFRQFPLVHLHPFSEKAAEASECAAEQGKFWEMHDRLFARQSDLSLPALKRYAGEIGLDRAGFDRCLESGAMAARVGEGVDDAHALGLRGTPTFIVGRREFEGPMSFAVLSQAVDAELTRRGIQPAQAATPTSPPSATGRNAAAPSGGSKQPDRPPAHTPSSATDSGSSSSGVPFGGSGASVFTQASGSALGCSEDEAQKKQPSLINMAQAHNLFKDAEHTLFVDVRSAKEYKSSRIRGAVNIPVDQFEAHWSTLPRDKTIVLYESGLAAGYNACAASRTAGRILLERGFDFDRVKVCQGGFKGWIEAGLPLEY